MKNERMYNEFVELVTTDAISGQESAVADKLAAKLADIGFTVIRDNAGEHYGGDCGNVIGIREGELDGALFFSSHMDRVPNGFGIKPVETDGVLHSDGTTILAADDISGVCAILEGLRQAVASGKPLPRLEVVFTTAEETVFGSKFLDMSLIQSKLGYAFDSPGPTGRMNNGAPGLYDITVEIKGRPAHAGNEPEKGIDAAKIMCDMLSGLKQGRIDFESTANFPILKTGSTARNVVCDFASFRGEARSRNLQKLEDYMVYFKEHCTRVAEAAGAEISIDAFANFLPFYMGEEEEVMVIAKEACEAAGIPYFAQVGGGGMDANIFNAQGMKTIGVATGYTGNHTTTEQLVLEDFYKSGELAAQMIYAYAKRCSAK